jgi:hypothetical protein
MAYLFVDKKIRYSKVYWMTQEREDVGPINRAVRNQKLVGFTIPSRRSGLSTATIKLTARATKI